MRKLKRRSSAIEEEKAEPVKKRVFIRYKKKQCDFINADGTRCKRHCTGRGNVCVIHGGQISAPETHYPITVNGGVRTAYDPIRHPMELLQHAARGLSGVEIAAELGISSVTLNTWREKHKEFNQAFEIGEALHEAWYIKKGKDNLDNRFFQTALYKFMAMNKLGWTDKVATHSTIQGTFGVLLVPDEMSMEDWERQNMLADGEEIIEMEVVKDA